MAVVPMLAKVATQLTIDQLADLSDKGIDVLAKALMRNLGDIKQYRVTKNYVLVGLYIGGNKIAGSNLLRSNENKKNDVFQSNCGVVLSMGPSAFQLTDGKPDPTAPKIGDWIYYRGGHQRMQINSVNYAFLHEDDVVSTVIDPSLITHKN